MLLCGALMGSGLTLRVLWGGLLTQVRHPEKMTERIVNRIDRRLDLNEEQARRVTRIVDQHMKALRDIRTGAMPRVQEQIAAMQREIRALLDPDQARQWDEDVEKFKRRWFWSREPAGRPPDR